LYGNNRGGAASGRYRAAFLGSVMDCVVLEQQSVGVLALWWQLFCGEQ